MWFANVLVAVMFSLLQSQTPSEQSSSIKTSATATAVQDAPVPAGAASPVDPTQPVITIHGLCAEGDRAGKDKAGSCNTAITRKEFESLMDALNPGGQPVSPSGRQNLAQAYVEALAFADAAAKAGLNETEQFRKVLYWARLRTIADLYRRKLQEQYRSPSPEEVDTYYQQHLASYDRVHLLRILVPRGNFSGADKDEFDKKALATTQVARQRAAKGDDLEQIQKDAYTALGLGRPPATDLGTFQRSDFIEKEAADVFSLQPGEISPLEIEIKSYVIYKVVSKETLKEEQVKADIVREISQQKYRDAIKAVLDSNHMDFNEQYFGPMAPKPAIDPQVLPRRPAR